MRFKLSVLVLFLASCAEAQIGPIFVPGGSGGSAASKTVLSADTNFYVRTNGSDSNSGLANTAGGAWLTLQGAWDNLKANYSLSGSAIITVNVAAGTYAGNVAFDGYVDGSDANDRIVSFLGDAATPANVIIDATGSYAAIVPSTLYVAMNGFKVTGSSDVCVYLTGGGGFFSGANSTFDTCAAGGNTFWAFVGAIDIRDSTVIGNADSLVAASELSSVYLSGITLSGTPAFSNAVLVTSATSSPGGVIVIASISGAATGKKFDLSNGGQILAPGITLPGNSAGTIDYGGVSTIVGSVPTVSACGAAPSVVVGSDNSGRLTVGGGGATTSCTLTWFNPTTTAPFCTVMNETTSQIMTIVPTATTGVITGVDFQSDVVSFMCKH